MDFLKNLGKLSSLSEKRMKQLQIQERMDNELEFIAEFCPKEVSHFLLDQRENGRKNQKDFINGNISNYVNISEQQLKQNDKIYKNFYEILKNNNLYEVCKCLEKKS